MDVIACWLLCLSIGTVAAIVYVETGHTNKVVAWLIDSIAIVFGVSVFTGSLIAGLCAAIWGVLFAVSINGLLMSTKLPMVVTMGGSLIIMFASVNVGFLVAG